MTFPEEVLRASVPLFSQVKMFADHPEDKALFGSWVGSVRDEVGIVQSAEFDEKEKGVRIKFRVFDSSFAGGLRDRRKAGFIKSSALSIRASADSEIRNEGGERIRVFTGLKKIVSVDFVTFPEAGGVVETVNSAKLAELKNEPEEKEMTKEELDGLRASMISAVTETIKPLEARLSAIETTAADKAKLSKEVEGAEAKTKARAELALKLSSSRVPPETAANVLLVFDSKGQDAAHAALCEWMFSVSAFTAHKPEHGAQGTGFIRASLQNAIFTPAPAVGGSDTGDLNPSMAREMQLHKACMGRIIGKDKAEALFAGGAA
jgi:hypothetical protein